MFCGSGVIGTPENSVSSGATLWLPANHRSAPARVIEMCGLFQTEPPRNRNQSIDAQIGERFVRGLNGGGVEFDPAGVGNFTKRPVAVASRCKSAGVNLSPSLSHSAETENQSMPLPLMARCGRNGRLFKKSR